MSPPTQTELDDAFNAGLAAAQKLAAAKKPPKDALITGARQRVARTTLVGAYVARSPRAAHLASRKRLWESMLVLGTILAAVGWIVALFTPQPATPPFILAVALFIAVLVVSSELDARIDREGAPVHPASRRVAEIAVRGFDLVWGEHGKPARIDPQRAWLPLWGRIATGTVVLMVVAGGVGAASTATTPAVGDDAVPLVAPIASPSDAPTPTAAPSATATPTPTPIASPTPTPTPTPTPDAPTGELAVVSHVVDGDTVDLADGRTVRIVGIDTPERGDCNYAPARDALAILVEDQEVTLVATGGDDADHYGRILRYLDVDGVDAGLAMIETGFAIARYDSRDGYGYHPREPAYIAADHGATAPACAAQPAPEPSAPEPTQAAPVPFAPAPEPATDCHPNYDPCLPIVHDLDCGEIDGARRVIGGSDPYRLDRDGDGWGCE